MLSLRWLGICWLVLFSHASDVAIILPAGYRSVDGATNTFVYQKYFWRGDTNCKTIDVEARMHLSKNEIQTLSDGTALFCQASLQTILNQTRILPIPIEHYDEASGMVYVNHPFKAGAYSLRFVTQHGRIIGFANFTLAIEYKFAPAESKCMYDTRYNGVQVCDRLNIGRGSYHHLQFNIQSTKPWTINIGQFTSIGAATLFLARSTTHRMNFVTTFPLHQVANPASEFLDEVVHDRSHTVTIGNDVWIGTDAVLLNNLTIGHGAVIGYGAVVRKSIPPYAIAYGNPAVVVKYRFPPEVVEKLLRMQWWNWADERVLAMARYGSAEEVIRAWEGGEI